MCIQCGQALVVWFVRKDHHLVLRRSLSAVAEGRRRGCAANGRRNELLLNRWALEGFAANSIQLVVPVILSFDPLMACNGH